MSRGCHSECREGQGVRGVTGSALDGGIKWLECVWGGGSGMDGPIKPIKWEGLVGQLFKPSKLSSGGAIMWPRLRPLTGCSNHVAALEPLKWLQQSSASEQSCGHACAPSLAAAIM